MIVGVQCENIGTIQFFPASIPSNAAGTTRDVGKEQIFLWGVKVPFRYCSAVSTKIEEILPVVVQLLLDTPIGSLSELGAAQRLI